jgi:hypothetical protein
MNLIAYSMFNFLIWLTIPAYCIYLYLTKQLKGALIIATGFAVQMTVNLLFPVLTDSFIRDAQFFLFTIPLVGKVILAVFFISGLHLLVEGR